MNQTRPVPALLLIVTYFLSGFAALLYQVVWQRLLGLFSGSDVRSVTIVTGAFLGGLGVGSLVGAIVADRMGSRRAVWIFGLCNLGIAAFAVLSRYLYYDLLFRQMNTLARSPLLLLVVSFISLLWPTTLMGLSLPLLSKALVRQVSGAAGQIGLLYGLNTVGAGVGAMITGWYLVGVYGYDRSLQFGGALSALVGLTALLIARQFEAGDGESATPNRAAGLGLRNVPRSVWAWSALVFVSGFMAISLELIWFRVLDVSLKSNAYTFAYLLAFILIGDGLGSLIGVRLLPRIQHPRRVFFVVLGLMALYALASGWGISWLAARFEPLAIYVARSDGFTFRGTAPLDIWLIVILPPIFVLLPPAILLGLYFPVVQKAVQTDYQAVGQRVGLIKVANIVGNTTGSVLTGTVLLDLIGTVGSLRLVGALGLMLVALLLWESWPTLRTLARVASGALAALLLAFTVLFPDTKSFWAPLHGAKPEDVFVVAEDSSGVAAIRQPPGATAEMFANGITQGNVPFYAGHGLLGVVPVIVHPNPERILLIGIGSAGTPYAAGSNPATKQIVAVEIVGAELDMLRMFAVEDGGQPIQKFLADPRYQIVVGDGRRELALTDEKFDIIQADAIRPWTSHSGLLYSREFFEEVRSHLAEGGIMAQWRATDRADATFLSVFPYVVNVSNFLLLGSDSPIPYDQQTVLQRLQDPQVVAYLAAGSYRIDEMRPWVEASPGFWYPDTPRSSGDLNLDLHPKDEYYLNNTVCGSLPEIVCP